MNICPDKLTDPRDIELFYNTPLEAERRALLARLSASIRVLSDPNGGGTRADRMDYDEIRAALDEVHGRMWRQFRYRWHEREARSGGQ